MNTDIRLSVIFFNHIKTLQLERRCGKEGVLCLLKLWVWAAVNRPSGDLSGYSLDDLELFSGWTGESGCFGEALRDIGWLDGEGESSFQLHGWEEFQTWVTTVATREEIGRVAFLARKNRTAYERLRAMGVKGITKDQYARLIMPGWENVLKEISRSTSKLLTQVASSPVPAPVPLPLPLPVPTPKDSGDEEAKKKKPKDKKGETVQTEFERQWDGGPIQRVSPLDYIRKIQKIAANAPKLEPRKLGSEVKAA